jgi:hypothetical protein
MFDFGKNTYQYEVGFKFDCISTQMVTDITLNTVPVGKHFGSVSKDPATNHTVLSTGEGSEASPLFQLRLGSDKIILWGGWHVPLPIFQDWCGKLLVELAQYLRGIPVSFIGTLTTQYNFAVPSDRMIPAVNIPEVEPIRKFYLRFIPQELLKRGNMAMVFGDELGRELLSWTVGAGTVPGHESITFSYRWNTMENQFSCKENFAIHLAKSNERLDKFCNGFLSLFVRK